MGRTAFQKRNYLAAGCTNGIYVGVRAESCEPFCISLMLATNLPTAFQKVLELISPTSIVAVPELNKFIVHCDMALFSYPLDQVVRVSQGHATPKSLGDCVERLAQNDGSVLFFRAGRVGHRTLSKEPSHVSICFVSHPQKLFMQQSHSCMLR
jgi:RHO1 GDP-GTP exchange protein 1/2